VPHVPLFGTSVTLGGHDGWWGNTDGGTAHTTADGNNDTVNGYAFGPGENKGAWLHDLNVTEPIPTWKSAMWYSGALPARGAVAPRGAGMMDGAIGAPGPAPAYWDPRGDDAWGPTPEHRYAGNSPHNADRGRNELRAIPAPRPDENRRGQSGVEAVMHHDDPAAAGRST
jgi:hypothetical protein